MHPAVLNRASSGGVTYALAGPLADFAEDTDLSLGDTREVAQQRDTAIGTANAIVPVVLFLGDAFSYVVAATVLGQVGILQAPVGSAFLVAALVTLGLMWAESLYPGYRIHPAELFRRRVSATLKPVLVVLAAMVVSGLWQPQAVLVLFLVTALMIQFVLRMMLRAGLKKAGLWGVPVVVLGDAAEAAQIAAYFNKNWQYGLRCEVSHGFARSADTRAALVVGALPAETDLDRLRRLYADVILAADLPCAWHASLRPADVHGEIGLHLARERAAPFARIRDRALDLVVASLALIVAAPVMLIACALIYAADPGPVIYRQTRDGFGGKPFRIFKLRTMYRDAEKRLLSLLDTDAAARAEWSAHYKLRQDPRILPVIGKFLRESSIDELPQLLNVLWGDMRIVGPRPFPDYHLAAMDPAFRKRRESVVPGLTGLWQICERSGATIDQQQRLDDFYIENRSIWFDLHIIFSTAWAVLRRDGAY